MHTLYALLENLLGATRVAITHFAFSRLRALDFDLARNCSWMSFVVSATLVAWMALEESQIWGGGGNPTEAELLTEYGVVCPQRRRSERKPQRPSRSPSDLHRYTPRRTMVRKGSQTLAGRGARLPRRCAQEVQLRAAFFNCLVFLGLAIVGLSGELGQKRQRSLEVNIFLRGT